jgi:hypothetical protein
MIFWGVFLMPVAGTFIEPTAFKTVFLQRNFFYIKTVGLNFCVQRQRCSHNAGVVTTALAL